MLIESPTIANFGGNLSFVPQIVVAPKSETEIIEILKQYAGRKIRSIGRLHSWSEAPRGDDVVLDLRHINHVKTELREGRVWATIGAGCQIKRLLTELE